MKRPKQHQIEEEGYEQFKACLPRHWVVRSQTHDYGIDREVEIFNQDANGDAISTGCIFKVQVKGTEDADVSKKGDVVRFKLEVPRTSYLCNEINVPTFFVLADVKSQKTWWYAIQIDKYLEKRLNDAIAKKQKKITLYIPSSNVLPSTLESLISKLDDIRMSHACESLAELPQENFDNLSFEVDEIEELERKFADKAFIAKITKLWKQKNRDYAALEKVSRDALSNVNNSAATKVSAVLNIEKALEDKVKGSPILQAQLDKIYFETAVAIKELTRNESKSWRLYSLLFWRSALLRIASADDFALFTNHKIHRSDDGSDGLDFICNFTLGIARHKTFKKVIRIYNQCIRLFSFALNSSEYWMIPQVILRVAQSLPPVFIHLWGEGLEETAALFRDHFNEILKKTASITFALEKWDDLALLVFSAFTLNSQKNQEQYQETYDWALATLNSIPDESRRKEWLNCLQDMTQTFDPMKNKIEFEEPDAPIEEEYQIYIQMAQAMGINLDDPNDRIAQIVNIGLKDLNPERVLKNCKHLFVYVGHYGIPAQMLKLYTAGSKYLRCTKKDVAIGGQSLDGIYDSLKREHCSKCKDADPWSEGWKWTRSWQNKESEKEIHKQFEERKNSF